MTRETCKNCGEELSDEELEMPMDDEGYCDDCADDRMSAARFLDPKPYVDPNAEHRLTGAQLGLTRLVGRV